MSNQYTFELPISCRRAAMRIIGIILLCLLAGLSTFAQKSESGKLFESPNATIYYEVLGTKSGTPLFVLHGGPGFEHTYFHYSPAFYNLAKHRPVVFYDQRGTGRSPSLKAGQSCTLADQVADLEALRAHLGFERIDLLGHSWGGFLAMAYAARYPDRVAHIIMVDSCPPKLANCSGFFEAFFPEAAEREKARAAAVERREPEAVKASLKEYLSSLFYSPEKQDAFLAQASSLTHHQEVADVLWRDASKTDLTPEAVKFRFPVLVITGRYDTNVAPIVAYRMYKAIPGSHFAVFEHSGHMPFYEEPEAFVQKVEGFLSGKQTTN